MDNCDKEHVNWPMVVGTIMAVAIGFFICGLVCMQGSWEKTAVKEGHARWVVTDDEGHTKFEWIKK